MAVIPKLEGKRFGDLTVQYKTTSQKYGSYLWRCVCKCGAVADRISSELTRNNKYLCCAECKIKRKKGIICPGGGLTPVPAPDTMHALVHLNQFFTNPVIKNN